MSASSSASYPNPIACTPTPPAYASVGASRVAAPTLQSTLQTAEPRTQYDFSSSARIRHKPAAGRSFSSHSIRDQHKSPADRPSSSSSVKDQHESPTTGRSSPSSSARIRHKSPADRAFSSSSSPSAALYISKVQQLLPELPLSKLTEQILLATSPLGSMPEVLSCQDFKILNSHFQECHNFKIQKEWAKVNSLYFFQMAKHIPLPQKAKFLSYLPIQHLKEWAVSYPVSFLEIVNSIPLSAPHPGAKPFYRAALCNNFLISGTCRKSACGFADNFFMQMRYQIARYPAYKTELCNIQTVELCKDSCHSVHIGDLVRKVTRVTLRTGEVRYFENFVGIQTADGPLKRAKKIVAASSLPASLPGASHSPLSPNVEENGRASAPTPASLLRTIPEDPLAAALPTRASPSAAASQEQPSPQHATPPPIPPSQSPRSAHSGEDADNEILQLTTIPDSGIDALSEGPIASSLSIPAPQRSTSAPPSSLAGSSSSSSSASLAAFPSLRGLSAAARPFTPASLPERDPIESESVTPEPENATFLHDLGKADVYVPSRPNFPGVLVSAAPLYRVVPLS